ncbi:MAG: transposase [Planctomycetaceae bacterium]|nr:transposase [Planctomycetaceae bacterium]
MNVATSFEAFLQVVAAVMTQPTGVKFRKLITGWVSAPRRTILGMVQAWGTDRHHAVFHRLFSAARWSIDRARLTVFDLITEQMPHVFLTIDDTLSPRFD